MRKLLLLFGALLSAAGAIGLAYFVRRIERDVFRVNHGGEEPFDLEAVAVQGSAVTLRPLTRSAARDLETPGWFGLAFDGGYGRLGPILAVDGRQPRGVTRQFEPVRGRLHEGAQARIDSFAFEGDPLSAHGIDWEHVEIECAGGRHPAWLAERSVEQWVIFVHGKGARREESLRALPVVHGEDWSCLAITYRNDVECPATATGCYTFGAEEWEDLEAAVHFARERGARRVVVAGYSMGGAIALSFLRKSSVSDVVSGLVLDAPMTDLASLLQIRARRNRLPAPLMSASRQLTGRRLGVDWTELDYHNRADTPTVPVLLFHGDQDDVIPVELSDRFAEARRDRIQYHRIPGAGHVRSWNVDRERYESALREWLRELPASPRGGP